MTWKETKQLIDADYSRLSKRRGGKLLYFITNHSFKISYCFRIGSYLKEKGGLGRILLLLVALCYKHYTYKTGIQMPFGTQVGGGFSSRILELL